MFADRDTPLNAFAGPFSRNFQESFRDTDTRGRQSEPPGVQGGKRNFEAGALFRDHVLPRYPHVRKPNNPVIERPQAHEPAAVGDLKSGRSDVHDECGDSIWQ